MWFTFRLVEYVRFAKCVLLLVKWLDRDDAWLDAAFAGLAGKSIAATIALVSANLFTLSPFSLLCEGC